MDGLLDRYGYYVVAGKRYYNKLQAFKEAFSRGYHPHWYFHEDAFSSADWEQEPEETLGYLYLQRAKQLREKYQTLILSFSGGSDSSTVADTFVYNHIRLDYLLNRSVADLLKRRDADSDESNMHNESIFSAYPQYKEYIKIQHDLKFVSWNYAEQMINFWKAYKEINPYEYNNYSPNLIIKDNILELFNEHKEHCCVIHAIDKPILFYINDRFYLCFMDEFLHQQIPSSVNHAKNQISTECFFWSKDNIKLLVKQGHILKRFFKTNPRLLPIISKFPQRPEAQRYRDIVSSNLYNESKLKLWQPEKAKYKWILESENWFFHSDTTASNNWKKFYDSVEGEAKKIFQDRSLIYKDNEAKDPTWNEKLFNGLPGCYSKLYDLGE
jgi:hypothetical protein